MLCLIFILNFGYSEKKKYEMLLLVKREMEFKGRKDFYSNFFFPFFSSFNLSNKPKEKTKKKLLQKLK